MLSRYETFGRSHWAELRASTPLALDDDDVAVLRGINDRLDLDEVTNIYLPLSRLLNLHIVATQRLAEVTDVFVGSEPDPVPFVIGLAGSVAVGKSTAARVLQALLAQWPDHPRVDLVTTDGFLLPNAELDARGLMERKGFPESYDTGRLVRFLQSVKSGEPHVGAPVYSHITYDIVDGEQVVVDRPDVLIVEGLNVLQAPARPSVPPAGAAFVSDYFDFSIYVDADSAVIEQWYVERFMTLRESVFTRPESFFQHFAALSDAEAEAVAHSIWVDINHRNLVENIAPTRERADLILTKGADHAVTEVRLRKN